MGSRGPAPTPTPTLRLRGSWLADTRDGEPQDAVGSPPCPAWLTGDAKKEWDRIVPILIERATLSPAELAMLAAYCQAWAEFSNAAKQAKAYDKGKKFKGCFIDHPRSVLNRSFERLHKAAMHFGLSPSSKTRLRVESQKRVEDDKAEFFANAG